MSPPVHWSDLRSRTGTQVLLACICIPLVHSAFPLQSWRGAGDTSPSLHSTSSSPFCHVKSNLACACSVALVVRSLLFLYLCSFNKRNMNSIHVSFRERQANCTLK